LLAAVVAIHVLGLIRPIDVLAPVDPWAIGRRLLGGQLPYRSFAFEYPPLSTLAFLLPGLVPHGVAKWALAAQALALEAVAVAFIRRHPGALRRYGVLSFLLFPFLAGGFDAAAMAALAAGTALLAADRAVGWGVVAVGTMVKLSPGVTWVWCRRRLAAAAVALAVTGVVIAAPVALARHRDDDWLTYNIDRGVQIESVAATTTWLARQATGHPSTYTYRFKAFEIDRASAAAAVWSATGALAMLWIALRARGRDAWRLSLLAVDVFLMASKVLSPQYVAWTAPLAAVVGGPVFVVHLVMAALTIGTYSVASGQQAILAVAALRNVVLVATVAAGLWQLRRPSPQGQAGGPQAAPRRGRRSPSRRGTR
jgi:hypothetical protein